MTDIDAKAAWPVEHWLSTDEVSEVEYSPYWNDEAAERGKAFDVVQGGFGRLEQYLDEVGLADDLAQCVAELDRRGRPLSGTGIDLAAGILWAAPRLLRAGAVRRLYCLEYSKHRLLTIGPEVLSHYQVDPDQVVLAFGSFYDLRVPDNSLDFAFLSQAFHHADAPADLLAELRRVLKPNGVVIMIGEHIIRPRQYAAHAVRLLRAVATGRASDQRSVLDRALRARGADLAPPDPELGDHSYTRSEYTSMFRDHGFRAHRLHRRGARYQSFLLERG